MLCRIAHILRKLFNWHGAIDQFWRSDQGGSEQFRSAIVGCLGDHDARDEHLFSLFQVF